MTPLEKLVERYSAPGVAKIANAAGQNAIALAVTKNWSSALQAIAEKIDAAESRRAELVQRRRSLLLDEGAEKEIARAESELAAVDRDLSRLRDARELAAEREGAQRQADEREAHARAVAEWERGNAELVALAGRADALAREAAETFGALADMAERQANACPGVGLGPNAADRLLGRGRAATACRWALAGAGAAWASPVGGVVPYPPPPGAAETIRAGLAWARRELGVAEDKAA